MAGTRIFLVDNGSYEPAATLALRGLAREVGKRIGQEVRPVSTMHSTKIAFFSALATLMPSSRSVSQTASAAERESAVSYTHLTLPTILRV